MSSRRRSAARQRQLDRGPTSPARRPGGVDALSKEALAKRPGFRADGLQSWETSAFFLGALCAVEPEYGPKLLLDHMQGDDGWWEDVDHVMGYSRFAVGLWGVMHLAQGRCAMPLHRPPVSDPPTVDELRAWVRVREQEIQRFTEGMGLSAKPEELEAEWTVVLHDLAKLKIEQRKIDRLLRREPPKDAAGANDLLSELQKLSLQLADIFFRFGRVGLSRREKHFRDSGMMGPAYDPCGCGSGKIHGACCGLGQDAP